ncbi:MAG TPA: hypothetical protein VIX82_10990, partial [Solirubrobacteraceae bacterium]
IEVAPEPASGHAVTIGPLRGRRLAIELIEQLDSLFGLRHCGRRLRMREHPSAYGQMGRCLSPCLGDLDPNLYRRRLDDALRVFIEGGDARELLVAHVHAQMREAAAAQRYERASWLRRRARRLSVILGRLDGALEATHARPKLVLAAHPTKPRFDAFWIVDGRLADWGPVEEEVDELAARTEAALRRASRRLELGAHVPPAEVDEVRIVATWLGSHPGTPVLALLPAPDLPALRSFVEGVAAEPSVSSERQLHDLGLLAGAADGQP